MGKFGTLNISELYGNQYTTIFAYIIGKPLTVFGVLRIKRKKINRKA